MSETSTSFGLTPPDELYELAESMRGVIEQMVRVAAPHAELTRARAEFEAIAARLEGIVSQARQPRLQPTAEGDTTQGETRPYYAGDATRWHYNPFHPPLQLERVGERSLRAVFRLGLTHEGPPGCVHGGFIAMLFDQVLGHANVVHGLPGLTARLTVRYRRPTPLFEDLVIETDAPEVAGERRRVVKGRILHNGVVTATGQGLFSRPEVELSEQALLRAKR